MMSDLKDLINNDKDWLVEFEAFDDENCLHYQLAFTNPVFDDYNVIISFSPVNDTTLAEFGIHQWVGCHSDIITLVSNKRNFEEWDASLIVNWVKAQIDDFAQR